MEATKILGFAQVESALNQFNFHRHFHKFHSFYGYFVSLNRLCVKEFPKKKKGASYNSEIRRGLHKLVFCPFGDTLWLTKMV